MPSPAESRFIDTVAAIYGEHGAAVLRTLARTQDATPQEAALLAQAFRSAPVTFGPALHSAQMLALGKKDFSLPVRALEVKAWIQPRAANTVVIAHCLAQMLADDLPPYSTEILSRPWLSVMGEQ